MAWVAVGPGLSVAAFLLPMARGMAPVAGVVVAAGGLIMARDRRRERLVRERRTRSADTRAAADARAVRNVLQTDALSMHFQPIVWMPTAEIVGYEALARFPFPPERPDQWFELARRCGLHVDLELAAIGKGLTALQVTPSDRYISLNVSPDALLSDELIEMLSDCPGDRVVLELTEHLPIEDYGAYLSRIERLRTTGIRLAVDDAGAGYSSLRHILILRPEIIKLDRTLTAGAGKDPVRRALLTCLATFAHATQTTLVAEGVETVEELAALIEYGVAYGQGYYFHRPKPLDELPIGRGEDVSPIVQEVESDVGDLLERMERSVAANPDAVSEACSQTFGRATLAGLAGTADRDAARHRAVTGMAYEALRFLTLHRAELG